MSSALTRSPRLVFHARGILRAPGPWLVALWLVLCAYLQHPVERSGDGAAYVLQALDGPWQDRAVHVGALLPLRFWLRALPGLSPITAAHGLTVLWLGAALPLSIAVGARLAPRARVARAFPALTLLVSATFWDAALFTEVYGPLATLVLAGVWIAPRSAIAAGLFWAWAALVHPGAWALVPAAVLLADLDRKQALLALGTAVLLFAASVGLLWPSWWGGGRGLAGLPARDVSVLQAIQRSVRLITRDLGLGAAPLLAGLVLASRRDRRPGLVVLLALVGTALGLDWYRDNAGPLPLLVLLAPFAAHAGGWMQNTAASLRRPLAAAALAVFAVGLAEATSRHDAVARSAERSWEQLEGCEGEGDDWATAQRRALSCR